MCKKIYLLCLQACLLFSLSASTMVSYADEPFVGEVRWFAGNFAPRGWAFCDGQLLPISSNQSLFSILVRSLLPTLSIRKLKKNALLKQTAEQKQESLNLNIIS